MATTNASSTTRCRGWSRLWATWLALVLIQCLLGSRFGFVDSFVITNHRFATTGTTTTRNFGLEANEKSSPGGGTIALAAGGDSWDLEELENFAAESGVIVSFTTLGPGYRAVARAQHNESLIIGYVEGFVR